MREEEKHCLKKPKPEIVPGHPNKKEGGSPGTIKGIMPTRETQGSRFLDSERIFDWSEDKKRLA